MYIHREITDALQPNLRPTGVPTNKGFLYATWRPLTPLHVTPNIEFADDRWSDMNTTPAQPFRTRDGTWDSWRGGYPRVPHVPSKAVRCAKDS